MHFYCWNIKSIILYFPSVSDNKIVAATINLTDLSEDEVENIMKVLKPYESNMKVLTKKDLGASADLDALGLGLKNSAGVNVAV